MAVWDQVSNMLGVRPLVSADIGGAVSLHAERYFIHLTQRQIPAIPMLVLACHLGGARASEGRKSGNGRDFIPSQSGLLPANCPTEWMFGGAVDVAIFYFPDVSSGTAARLQQLVQHARQLQAFTDPLVSALAQQIVDELQRGSGHDQEYLARLALLMTEQCCRVLEGAGSVRIRPDNVQLGRMEQVLSWIRRHLHEQLSAATLAQQMGVSESHFRRVFQQAMGSPPHRYIHRLRLERVRELLLRTDLSIARIANDCGFKGQSHMTASFHQLYGVTPARLRQLGKPLV